MAKILVTIVTGFLGSGKTSLLNALLKSPAMTQAAVIVNEFGEIGLDYDLVGRSDETVVQLENGCLCCTVKSDLIDTFRDLHLQRRAGAIPKFERVVIETTGIADPGPVLQIVLTDPLVSELYALDGVVTTVDAVNLEGSLDRFPESVKQVAIADRIVLTKTDLIGGPDRPERVEALRARLRVLNPAAPIIEKRPSALSPEDLFGGGLVDPETRMADIESWLRTQALETAGGEVAAKAPEGDAAYYARQGHVPQARHVHDPLIRSFCIVRDEPMAIDTLRLFLEGLTREAGPDLLRVKGIICVAERPERPAVIQGAQHIFHSLDWLERWPSADRRSRIVFITRGIDKSDMEATLSLVERFAARTAALARA
jgi:G3E family GTPase